EALRPRPAQRPRLEPRGVAGAGREPGVPDRPPPRQGNRPEHPGAAVRELDLRADLEPATRRLGADHGGRGGRHGRRPRPVLYAGGGAALAGGRGAYYDTAGAPRDMVQNHMMEVLCLVAMESPVTLDADAVRNE